MNIENKDQQLKALFDELRARDSAGAPSFEQSLRAQGEARNASHIGSPRMRERMVSSIAMGIGVLDTLGRRANGSRWQWAAALAVVVVAGGVMLGIQRHSAERELRQWAAFSDWKAPSDALLDTSVTPWGRTVATPTDLWLQSVDSTEPTKENL